MLPMEPSQPLTTRIDSTVLERAGVRPDAQLPRVLQDKRTGGVPLPVPACCPPNSESPPAVPTGAPAVPSWCPLPQPAPWQWRGSHRVDLAQDGALRKEERLASVHHNEVKIGSPGALRGLSLPSVGVGGVSEGLPMAP